MKQIAKIILFGLSSVIGACGEIPVPPCSCPTERPGEIFLGISDGEYQPVQHVKLQEALPAEFPHAGSDVTGVTMHVFKSENLVEFHYYRGTTEVIETWAIVENSIR